MREAKQAGIETLYLFTPDRVSFYEKLGWQILKEEVYRGHLVTMMSARLLQTHFNSGNSGAPVTS